MGTLFDQPERNHRRVTDSELDAFLSDAVKLAKKHSINVAEVIKAKGVLELERRNDLYVNNGDSFDEQMSGFGEILQEMVSTLEDLRNELSSKD
ncbi:hypothetical protein [Microcoleus sp. FACHB-672]|uniref:hypothetical protein n=1 Tax=Microcoleus sp. FACHB-672 TaxID=2692825 RepID=UPI001687473A|nr:hypothetical protein [Microcoleus sp. FACHB-672]MBD2043479.1 hypothetical protein [Microcoleus sp. FACHB-672]